MTITAVPADHVDAPARRVDAATLTTVTATGFLVALAALHVIKSDLSPTWRMVSEYEIGRNGWIMQAAFLLLAVSCVSTVVLLRPVTANRGGRIGRGALAVTAAGLTLAAFATSDPITASHDQLTTHGNLHGLGAMIGIPSFVVAAIAIARSLRDNEIYATPIRNATRVVLAAIAVFIVSMATMFHGAPATPDSRIGIQNRILVVAYAVWLLIAANPARHARR
jgi:uncharacterized membrane protein YidH (DUF202 family)